VPIEWSFVLSINNPLGLLENHGTVRIWPPGIALNNIQSRYKKVHYAELNHKYIQKDEQNVSGRNRITIGPDGSVLFLIKEIFRCAYCLQMRRPSTLS
jgi:hypothetical protein